MKLPKIHPTTPTKGDVDLHFDGTRIYPQFCVNVKGWCKIKVDRGGVQGSLFAALIAMKQKSCSLSRAAAQPLFIYP